MPPKYLSTDPNAGQHAPKYLSTDPNAGTQAPSDDLEALRQKSMQQANAERVGAMGAEMARENPNAILGSERFRQFAQPHDPEDVVFKTGTVPQKIHRAVENVTSNLWPAVVPLAFASPAAAIGGGIAGTAGSFVGKQGAKALGAPEDWSDVVGDVGGLAGAYGGSKLASGIAPEDIARTFRDPETGKLKPSVKTSARVAGGTAGGFLGHVAGPGGTSVGVGLGSVYGPSIVDSIVPRLPEPELGSPENPGWFSKIPTKMPSLPPAQPELGSPDNPGWMVKLPDRMPAIQTPEPELGSPENPGWVVKLPNRMPEKTPQFGSPENPGWVVNLPNRMPRTPEPEPELGSPDNPGWFSKIPNRMPALPAAQPELGTPENPGWFAPLPNRMPVKPETMPEIGSPENPGFYAKLPTRMPKIGSATNPNITVEGFPGIGASSLEREMQTISDPSRVITPSEFQRLESVMGKDAYPRPGESQFDYRKRLTGGWKAARARTERSP